MIPLLFSIVVLFWVSGFDIIYSLQDEEFDKIYNLHSIPVLNGKEKALYISRLLHVIAIITMIFIGFVGNFNHFYWIGTIIFSILIIYQHNIVNINDLSNINLAFFTTNGIASIIFGIFVILDILI